MSRRHAVILGGINGAGKTTVAQRMALDFRTAPATFLNPDKIAAEIAAQSPISKLAADIAAMRRVSTEIRRFIEAGHSFVAETVLANKAYRHIAREAMESGFYVRLFFVALPTVEIAIERVARRVTKGGHHVPEQDIRRRWPQVYENLTWFAANVDEVFVLDNASGRPRWAATVKRGIVRMADTTALPAVEAALRPLLSPSV